MGRPQPAFVSLAMIGLISAAVIGGGVPDLDSAKPSFRIVHLSQVEPGDKKAFLDHKASKTIAAAVRKELSTDPVLARKLRARGIHLRNVIGSERTPDGVTNIYIR